jgi:hypothetical protein
MPVQRGEPLPADDTVIRLLTIFSKDGRVAPTSFSLSSEDERSELKAISVFALRLTTPIQARDFMRADSSNPIEYYAPFLVCEIRGIRPDPDSPQISNLDVQWDPLDDDESKAKPGVEGHAGITGLYREAYAGLANVKNMFKSLRSQLADIAEGRKTRIL